MKFSPIRKSQGYIFSTILGVVFIGACYYFIYLPANEDRIEQQRFRTLQNIDINIHQKIENSTSLINNLLDAYNTKSKNYLDNYIDHYAKDKFILSRIATIPKKDSTPILPGIIVNNATGQIILQTQKQDTDRINYLKKGTITFTFRQFITALLPELVFDEYIIFSRGNTVYESFPSGISNAMEDTLLNVKNGVGGSYVKDITVGGRGYKLFLQPVSFDSSNKFVLGGLLSKSRYQAERSQLPARLIMLMVTVVLGMIIIFPWIKLYQMGSKDRLTLIDGASSIVVSMLLMSLLFFCFFKYNTSMRANGSPESKKRLAADISGAFNSEIKRVFTLLNRYETIKENWSVKKNIINLNKSTVALASGGVKDNYIDSGFKHSLDTLTKGEEVRQVFWLDDNGDEMYNWTSDSINSPPGKFKLRDYFANIKSNNYYYINDDTTQKFFLDQVISWTSGSFTSVLSIPSKIRGYVAAISFNMRSVQDVVLPTGYTFAVIDAKGKILYHSVKARNLNENLISEFSSPDNLISSLNARAEGEFSTNYYSKNYAVSITPIKGIPYFVIIFSDTAYKELRDVEIYSFTFSMLILLFLYIVLQLSITFLVSSQRSFFKKQLFNTAWVGPKLDSRKEYLFASFINLLIIILLAISFRAISFLEYLYLLFFAITFISLFFNTQFAIRYKRSSEITKYHCKRSAVWWTLVLLSVIDIAAYYTLCIENFGQLMLTELMVTIIGYVFIFVKASLPEKIRKIVSSRFSYIHGYALMVLTGLIITSGIPVAFFYITSYNYEQNLGIRHRQTDYAKRLLVKPQFDLNKGFSDTAGASDKTGIYYDGAWISTWPSLMYTNKIERKVEASNEQLKARKILGTFRINIGDNFVKTHKLYLPYSSDTSIIYHPLLINTYADSSVSTYVQTNIPNKYLRISSYKLNYVVPLIFTSILATVYWLFLLLALVLFYFVIINIVKKLFSLNLPDLEIWKALDDKMLVSDNLNNLLFVIGLPGSGKLSHIIKKFKDAEVKCNEELLVYDPAEPGKSNIFIADFLSVNLASPNVEQNRYLTGIFNEAIKPKNKVIIINHFEYNIQNDQANLAKLNFIEKLMLDGRLKIIILSTIHPVLFLDSINDLARQGVANNKVTYDFERWNVLLGHFRIMLIPISEAAVKDEVQGQKLIYEETNYTHFLHNMQEHIIDIGASFNEQKMAQNADRLAYKLQVTSLNFYMYIWQSLTKEEKFLLYDLAEDNLVNAYDDYNLTMLIAKGVIIYKKGSLRIFNKGFRNFILTAIGNTEAMKIKEQISQSGNWGNLRTPLIIIIMAILAFLLVSQQEAYSKLLTYAAALSAGVPAILKVLSLFDKNSSKTGT